VGDVINVGLYLFGQGFWALVSNCKREVFCFSF